MPINIEIYDVSVPEKCLVAIRSPHVPLVGEEVEYNHSGFHSSGMVFGAYNINGIVKRRVAIYSSDPVVVKLYVHLFSNEN